MLKLYFDWIGPYRFVPNGMVPGDKTTEYSQGVYQDYGNQEKAHYQILHQHQNLMYHAGFHHYLEHFEIPHQLLPILTKRPYERGLCLMEPYGGIQRLFADGNPLGLDFPKLISQRMLQGLQRGNVWLMFNYTLEGFVFRPRWWERMARVLTAADIPLSKVIIINGNELETQEKMDEWAQETGNEPMHIITYGVSEDLFRIHIRHEEEAHPDRVWLDHKTRGHFFPRPKKYLCMNRRPHPHRTALLVGLTYMNLLSHGAVSFPNKSEWGDPRAEGRQYWEDEKLYWGAANALMELPPLRIDQPDITAQYMDYTDSNLFADTYFSLITETLYTNYSIFPTEKTYRAISQWHPFIIVGNLHFLRHLRSMGYKTFNPIFDEAYDEEPDEQVRMKKILGEVERLCHKTPEELQEMYELLLPILEHNANHLLSDRPWGILKTAQQLEAIIT